MTLSHSLPATAEPAEVGRRARRHAALRLLPFVFLLYVVNYIDRINVSFASLKMSADLGLSDRVYGLGVAAFYVSYILLEIPGAIIAERWSPRRWIARIMISWGAVTILTGFIHNTGQFYLVRFLLGAAEASFLPAIIVYLTRWFTVPDRSRACAALFAALPVASLIGSPLAGALLGVNWLGLNGWRWLFIVEGVPAVLIGIVTLVYLTERPAQRAGCRPRNGTGLRRSSPPSWQRASASVSTRFSRHSASGGSCCSRWCISWRSPVRWPTSTGYRRSSSASPEVRSRPSPACS
jgi:ACS family tartrate transporter-like MFS transporter